MIRRVFQIILCLLAVKSATPCLAVSVQEHSLLAHARKVVDADLEEKYHYSIWLAPDILLGLYETTNRATISRRLNLTTHKQTPPVEVPGFDMGYPDLGPTARWLIQTIVHSSGTFQLANDLEGSGSHQMRFGVVPDYIWNQDGHHLAELYAKSGGRTLAIVRDLNRPTYRKRCWLKMPALCQEDPHIAKGEEAVRLLTRDWRVLRMTKLSERHRPFSDRDTFQIEATHLGRHIESVHRHTVSTPHAWKAKHVMVAPNGKRLLWLLQPRLTPPRKQNVLTSVWVSDLSGQRLHRVGDTLEPNADVQWLPDSKQISFLHQKALYVTPVN